MTMRKLLTAVAAVSTLAVALPAMAQDFNDVANHIQDRIQDGVSDGSLTWYEARDLRSRLHNLERLQGQYEGRGMRGWMSRDLDQRYDALSSDVASERNNTEYRYRRSYDY
jgi:hypothetical protein